MEWGSPLFVLAIIAMSIIAWVVTTAIRAAHGYPVENEWGGLTHKAPELEHQRQTELLALENEALRGKLSRIEERVSVLERITTDKAGRLSDEIDQLR
ncbi:MAG TPA: hypothetical protein PK808_01770 [Polymorphobacter sp.]|nr:hypothetical protein [Polymorphobacter sp.]